MDLPPFRPSLDFVPPPLPGHATTTSLDFGTTSFEFGLEAPLQHSTPHEKANLHRRGSHKSNRSLPEMTPKTGLLEDVKQALKHYGRSIDTPAKTPRQAKRNVIKRKASGETKSPLKGILKSRPSLDSLAVGLDLPPIPTQMRKAADKETKAAGKAKTIADRKTEPVASVAVSSPPAPVNRVNRVPVPYTALETVAERDEVSNRSIASLEAPHSVGHDTHQPEAMNREHGLPVDSFELSFEHDPEQLEEMEMVMTQFDSFATDAYISSTSEPSLSRSNSFNRPHSFAGSTSASKLQLPIPHKNREAEGKVSTETFMTMDSVGIPDPIQDSPSPALATQSSRGSLILVSNRSRESSAGPATACEPQAISSETISSGGKKAVRSSVHGQNNVSTFKRNSGQISGVVPLRSGLKPLILAPVARGERATMLSDDNLLSARSDRLGVKQDQHGRGDSAFKFDDADDDDAIFTHSPRKAARNPLQEKKNVITNVAQEQVSQKQRTKDATVPIAPAATFNNNNKSSRGPPVSPKKMNRPSSRASSRGPAQARSVRL
jgi:hypothetical protein